jgi:hypothetical protein
MPFEMQHVDELFGCHQRLGHGGRRYDNRGVILRTRYQRAAARAVRRSTSPIGRHLTSRPCVPPAKRRR